VLGIAQLPAVLVLLPVILYIWTSGDYGTASAIVYSALLFAAGMLDNVLKPLMLGRGVDAPMPVILLGALGGMAGAGIVGLFVGAVLLALGYQIFMGWVHSGFVAPEARRRRRSLSDAEPMRIARRQGCRARRPFSVGPDFRPDVPASTWRAAAPMPAPPSGLPAPAPPPTIARVHDPILDDCRRCQQSARRQTGPAILEARPTRDRWQHLHPQLQQVSAQALNAAWTPKTASTRMRPTGQVST
jgi:hypothetical protein